MNYLDTQSDNAVKYLEHLRKMDISYKVEEFVKNVQIPITLNLNAKDKKYFTISEKVPKNDFAKMFMKKDHIILKDIQGFLDNFPNFVELYQDREKKNEDLIRFMTNRHVTDTIKAYFNLVDEALGKYENYKIIMNDDKNFKKDFCIELHSYIMKNIYNKMFSNDIDSRDEMFYDICRSLQWVKPEQILGDSNMILDNFLPDAIQNLRDLDYKKSPTEKIKSLKNVTDLIQNTIIFSTGKSDNSVDDNTPFLLFALIKAQPKNLCSNLKYVEEFLDPSMAMDNQELMLIQFSSASELLFYF